MWRRSVSLVLAVVLRQIGRREGVPRLMVDFPREEVGSVLPEEEQYLRKTATELIR